MGETAIFIVSMYSILILPVLYKKIFYRGYIDIHGWTVYNLSNIAESIIIIINTTIIIVITSNLHLNPNLLKWYEYLGITIVDVAIVIHILKVYNNRNNYIKIRDTNIDYSINYPAKISDSFKIVSYKIYDVNADGSSPYKDYVIELRKIENGQESTISIILNKNNLQGFVKHIESLLEKNCVKKH